MEGEGQEESNISSSPSPPPTPLRRKLPSQVKVGCVFDKELSYYAIIKGNIPVITRGRNIIVGTWSSTYISKVFLVSHKHVIAFYNISAELTLISTSVALLRISIRRIHMFLGLPEV